MLANNEPRATKPADVRGGARTPLVRPTAHPPRPLRGRRGSCFVVPQRNPDETYTVELKALGGWSTPGIKRLRALLKTALRAYGLRCTSAVEVTAETR